MREIVYLVGQISPKLPITYQWRKDVINHFEAPISRSEIEFIDPCQNEFNLRILEKQHYAVRKDGRVPGIDVLPPKDRTYVKRSSIGLVNLNHYDPRKPLLGTFYECSWYYDSPEKTVIAFADDLNSYECQHPFIRKTVHTWCQNEQEACEIIEAFFL